MRRQPGSADRSQHAQAVRGRDLTDSDYIVVGAGSAGCAIAARLSERPGNRVTLIEAGGAGRSPWVHMPIGYGGAFFHPKLNWRYYTEPDTGLGGRRAYWPRGKVVGGSSAINAMVFIRGQAADYDAWGRDNPGWSFADLLPHFRALEDNLAGADAFRAQGGPITIRDMERAAHPLAHAFVAAAQSAGYPRNPDFNGAMQDGVGFYQITTRRGLRCSAATGYLRPALKRPNLRLLTDALVTGLTFDGTRVTGITILRHGRSSTIHAHREVIVCAGAVNSPQLLQLSGIGAPERLRALGIAPRADLPGVGGNLQDHVGFDYVYRANRPSLNNTLGPLLARGLAGAQYLMTRDGPLSLSVNQAGGFVRSEPGRDRPNLQLYFSPLSYSRATPGKRRLTAPDPFPGFMLGVSNCHPESRGHLHIRSADPLDAPQIRPNYLSHDHDIDELLASIDILRTIARQPEMAAVIAEELIPGAHVTDRDALLADLRARITSVYHPCGTCNMGPATDPLAVVDHRLRVHGIAGLRVADASIFPSIPAGNLNAPSIMTGEKAAAMILEDSP